MSAVYGASLIKRQRRTRDEVEQLERQILDILEQDHPQSVRHVFYRLTDPRLLEPVPRTSAVVAPLSCSRSTPMISSSLNRLFLIVRLLMTDSRFSRGIPRAAGH